MAKVQEKGSGDLNERSISSPKLWSHRYATLFGCSPPRVYEGYVVATDPASVNTDYDNDAAVSHWGGVGGEVKMRLAA
jgi:hypothetical protein